MTTYKQMMVAGFFFTSDRENVLLVEKKKPSWQAGLLNGVGGKCEFGETAAEAMVREFEEETTHHVCESDWFNFAVETHRDYELHCFMTVSTDDVKFPYKNDAGEDLVWVDAALPPTSRIIGNLQWLLPLARDWRRKTGPVTLHVEGDIKEIATW